MTLPTEFESRLKRIFSDVEWEVLQQSFSSPRVVGCRVNTLHSGSETILSELAAAGLHFQSVEWSPTSFWIEHDHRDRVTHSEAANDGRLYVQSLSSQIAAVLLAPQPGETVLDLAAAPGGKTSHLAALMQNKGLISAVEPIRTRYYRMRANLQRMGVSICRFYQIDGRTVGRKTGPRFDRVLLDAPCSAESRIRLSEPESAQFWSERKIREASRKQRGLIRSGFEALKPGGVLLYCTCTFAPEENEAIVDGLLGDFPQQAILEPLPEWLPRALPGLTQFDNVQFDNSVSQTRRILPSPHFDGFYFALIRKAPHAISPGRSP